MLTVNITGNTIHDIAREALKMANSILDLPKKGKIENQENNNLWDGYRPVNVGRSEYRPVDDGREWDSDSLRKWIENLRDDGRKVVGILARGKIIDQREQAKKLGWSGSQWAGVWTGPRRQASYVMFDRGLSSWPYGHTYSEPRRMWMHENIAEKVLDILKVK